MIVGVPRETSAGERRVALVPDIAGRLAKAGFDVLVEHGAGAAAGFRDEEYTEAGARIVGADALYAGAEAVVRVVKPSADEAARMRNGTVLIAHLQPLTDTEGIRRLADGGLVAFAMESIPRITRAQPMDALS